MMMDSVHLEQIYDMPSEQLQMLEQTLRRNAQGNQQLLQKIVIEIQQRKTLEFFAQYCQVQNPYTKKVTQFNNEFLKLAEEAIKQNTQSQPEIKEKQLTLEHKTQLQKFRNLQKNATTIGQSETDNETKTQQSQMANRIENMSLKSHSRESQKTDNFSQLSVDKKMNIGVTKKKKNKMKQMMAEILAKTRVTGDVVIGKAATASPQKAQPQRKYHIPGQKHENLQLKSTQTIKKDTGQKSTKKIEKKPNKQQLLKKKQQISEKNKTSQKQGFKLPKVNKNNANKKYVEMVRKEEEQRKAKTQKLIRQKDPITLPRVSSPKQEIEIMEQIVTVEEDEKKKYQSEKSISEDIIRQHDIIAEESIEESISPSKIEKQKKESIKPEVKPSNTRQAENKNYSESIKTQIQEQKLQKASQPQERQSNQPKQDEEIDVQIQLQQQEKTKQVQNKDVKMNNLINEPKKEVDNEPKKEREYEPKKDVDYTSKLIQQIQQEQQQQYYFFNREGKNQQVVDYQIKQEKVIENQPKLQKEENKSCYNIEYWVKIRQDAESKIRRFKQEKQLEEMEKQRIEKMSEEAITSRISEEVKQAEVKEQSFKEDETDKHIRQQQNELKKMKNLMKKTEMKKKSEARPPAPPKLIRPKPQFDYLSVYPTFNHIFSVMYTKPTSQAILDIPILMKEMKTLFANHLDHFKNRNTFQPALFLPFDQNPTRFTDPKQLILSAENTYVDLRVMMERTELFNANLHGSLHQNENRYYRVAKSKQQVYDIITTSFMRRKGWKELPYGCGLRSSWNLFWSWSKPEIQINKLLVWQRINHFPFNKNLSRKDLLYKNLEHFRKTYRVSMGFLPLTYNLPKDFTQFSIKFHEEEMINRDHNYWIMKPIGKSRGRGIKVIGSLNELNYIDNIVVQKYLHDPLLLDGYKFDMRIYVLVTSFHPLQAFIYKEGFARLSTEKYKLDPQSIKNSFMHLTNFSINKNNLDANENFVGGSKISLKSLKEKVNSMGYSFSNIWLQVQDIIIKSLLGCSISVPSLPTAFELFGYDIMIDKQGQCHLIEINASPSLERSFLIDEIVKQSLVDDIIDIIDPPDFDKGEFLDVISERLQESKKKLTPQDDLLALARILKYKPLRKVGEQPKNMGLFEMIAPSEMSSDLEKLIKSKSGANNPQNID